MSLPQHPALIVHLLTCFPPRRGQFLSSRWGNLWDADEPTGLFFFSLFFSPPGAESCGPFSSRKGEAIIAAGKGEAINTRDAKATFSRGMLYSAVIRVFHLAGCPHVSSVLQRDSDPCINSTSACRLGQTVDLPHMFASNTHIGLRCDVSYKNKLSVKMFLYF